MEQAGESGNMVHVGAVLLRAAARCAFAVMMLSAPPLSAAALSHFPDPMFHDGMEGAGAGPFNDFDAARFLAQATFGPNDADIADLRARGYQGWIDRQMDPVQTPPSSQLAYYSWVSGGLGENTGYGNIVEAWFLGALGGPDPQFPANAAKNHTDQLRQRIAFALSEIFVISDQNTFIDQHPDGQAYFYDILSNNAFGNFRTLLEQVTLSPAMGVYLNMQGNPRANLAQNLHPDENYAREINQLFSIGLVVLNQDGTPFLSGGKPVPTYDQSVVTNFAHVFTGWTWAGCTTAAVFKTCGQHGLDFQLPMIAPSPYTYHDNGTDLTNDIVSKQLLNYPPPNYAVNPDLHAAVNGGVLAAGGTPQTDLTFALDNIFNHPNVGPFISKQLIQRLVTSNPSPQYVRRVSNVFNNNGSNQRGDLAAVARAILLDPEARYGQFQDPEVFGKLREPLLRITHFWRVMGARHQCAAAGYANGGYLNPYRYAGYDLAYGTNDTIYGNGVGQAPIKADTVFNFFKPGYIPGGEMAAAGLLGPEFQINTDTLISNSTTAIIQFYGQGFDISDAPACTGYGPPGEVAIDRSSDIAFLTANGNAALIDRYSKLFMSGQMSPFMRQTLLTYLNSLGGSAKQRVNALLMLVLTSPEYMIQK
ncbi:MAG TPA: DUF1800 family protein [Rhodanobacteraceae bacterium]|nr:DUF1800 family protein [Rhodanobacteraceae bacterium]